ncbi:MAG: DEAD/DEAH box helicase [Methanomethylovorans sp.]|jgi:helicase|nr:DEAD/DEAH box helicase [Methanomethylovorans sp.]
MSLWILVNTENSKLFVMVIKGARKLPVFTGEVILKNTAAGARPYKFKVYRDNKEEYLTPADFIDLLRMAARIMIAKGGNENTESSFFNMLKGFQLEGEYVNVCRFCLLKRRFNFLNRRSIKYHSEKICKECAKEELFKVINSPYCHYSDEAKQHIEEMLLQTRDFDRTVATLNPENLDKELTKFDTVEASFDAKTVKIIDLPISNKFKELLLKKSDELLPVQTLAVDAGLFKGKHQLVTSVTATGKTLIGELAGIENILRKKGKMLYLVPLVALANQKYDQFSEKYATLGLTTSIRIGSSRIRTSATVKMRRSLDSDIIVGTYEGIDFILRSGDADLLGKIGTVVIDEVHTLEDAQRGHRVDGVIGRLKYVAPAAQFIYLSATVAEPVALSQKLNATLVEYEYRPVPIERHLIFCEEHEKIKLMTRLVKEEFARISSKGHRGQTIIFTNSRRNCHSISEALPIVCAPYHAGLTQSVRKSVEERFLKGKLPVVVTTAALAAGVDFPASQVIFESLAMGIEWLNMQEFMQMLGRAGRPDYHDRGIVVLLATPNKRYSSEQTETEDAVAIRLLKGKMLPSSLNYGEDEQMEEILASAAITSSKKDLAAIHKRMLGNFDLDKLVEILIHHKFLEKREDNIFLTSFGQIAAAHFLSVSTAFLIRDAVLKDKNPLEIITNLEFFDAVYFKYAAQISAALDINVPSRVFQGASLDLIFEGNNISQLDINIQEKLFAFAEAFLTCKCKDSPYCGCAERLLSAKIVEIRMDGYDPAGVVHKLEDTYGLTAYAGDVLGYLENVVRNLDAVEKIAMVYHKKDIAIAAREMKQLVEG